MKTKLIISRSFIVIILILFLCSLITLNLLNKYIDNTEKFDSYKEMKDKVLSKKELESFIMRHRMKGNLEYTKKIITPLIADKDQYKQVFAMDVASEITGEYDYNLYIYNLNNNAAYYSLEIPHGKASKGEPEVTLNYGFKMIKKDNKWVVQKICVFCEIDKL